MSKKLGIDKKTHHEAVHDGTVEHRYVPGRAYEFTNPTEKLISMIGGGFFNEPKYYDTNRSYAEFYRELMTTGKIASTIVGADGLTEQARDVVETATAVAHGDHPEDLLMIAAWARDPEKGLKLRYTPQIMLCIASAVEQSRNFVPKYARSIIQRADEIRHVFAAYRHMFCDQKNGRAVGKLPLPLRRALAVAFAAQNVYGLIKYNSDDRPKLGDVLLMCRRGKEIRNYLQRVFSDRPFKNWPVSQSMFEYLVNGKITEDAPAMLKARQEFFGLTSIKEVTKELLDKAGLTWENIVSKFGSTKDTWELAIPYMGEMALTRNLRNFEQAEISEQAWDLVYKKCASITDTRQLPFRFFSADQQVSGTNSKSIAAKMLDNSCLNVPGLDGVTAIFVDNSGSTTGCPVSGKSDMRVAQCGNMLSAIIAKKMGRKCKVGVFGDSMMWVPFADTDSCMNIFERINKVATSEERSKYGALAINAHWKSGPGVGGGTETGLWCGLHDLTEKKIHVDRIIIVSDFCCYTQGDSNNCGQDMNRYFGKSGDKATIQSMIDRYRMAVNKDCWVHSVDLSGHGQSQTKPGTKNIQTLSGWSEQVFGIMHAAEAQSEQKSQAQGEPVQVPTMEILRQRYFVAEPIDNVAAGQ